MEKDGQDSVGKTNQVDNFISIAIYDCYGNGIARNASNEYELHRDQLYSIGVSNVNCKNGSARVLLYIDGLPTRPFDVRDTEHVIERIRNVFQENSLESDLAFLTFPSKKDARYSVNPDKSIVLIGVHATFFPDPNEEALPLFKYATGAAPIKEYKQNNFNVKLVLAPEKCWCKCHI
jgi:hypothetical protein